MEVFNLLIGLCYLLRLCYEDEEPFLNSFSSKTAYRNSRMKPWKDLSKNEDNCKLIHINALFRHGTRFSSKNDMIKIKQVHKKIMASKYSSGLPKPFLEWKFRFSLNLAKQLCAVGYEEMMDLGRRFRNRFDKIEGYKNKTKRIKVFSSSVSRSRLSGAAFLEQFLQKTKTFKEAYDMISERDSEMRFFDKCPFYTNSVLNNKSSEVEYKRFLKGPEIRAAVKDVQKRWNLMDVNLTADDVKSLYVMCGYEIATNESSSKSSYKCIPRKGKNGLFCPAPISPLCSLLKSKDYPIFEYLADLKHYWRKAYGRKINWLQSCDLMSPMLKQITEAAIGYQNALRETEGSKLPLESHLDRQNYSRATFWFGHAETVLPLAALLDLFNQTPPPTADSFQERLTMIKDEKNRFKTFRVSNIAPFSGNIALELHHCPHLVKADRSGFMITVKSNEKTVQWSLANEKKWLSLESFKEHLKICSPELYNHNKICVLGEV